MDTSLKILFLLLIVFEIMNILSAEKLFREHPNAMTRKFRKRAWRIGAIAGLVIAAIILVNYFAPESWHQTTFEDVLNGHLHEVK